MAIMDTLANKKASLADTSYWQRWLRAQQKKAIPKTTTVNRPAAGQLGKKTETSADRNRIRRGTAKKPAPQLPPKPGNKIVSGQLGDVEGTRERQAQNSWVNWYRDRGGGFNIPYNSSIIYGNKNIWQNPFKNPVIPTMETMGGKQFSNGNTWLDYFREGPFTLNPSTKRWDDVNTGGVLNPYSLDNNPMIQKVLIDNGVIPDLWASFSAPPDQLPPANPQPDTGGGGGGGGYYEYPELSYGGGGGGYRYPSYSYGGSNNDINRWYANMVQWNINRPKNG